MTRTTGQKNKKSILPEITLTNPQRLVFGSFLVILGVLVFISILSYFFTFSLIWLVVALALLLIGMFVLETKYL